MQLLSLGRALKIGLNNFWRNMGLNFATTTITTLTLFVISLVIILNVLGSTALTTLKDKVDISVYLKTDVTEDDLNTIIAYLNTKDQIKEIKLTTKEEALAKLQQEYSDNPAIVESLYLIGNPLQPTISFKTKQFEDYEGIVGELNSGSYSKVIDNINYEDNRQVIDKLSASTRVIANAGILISVIFVLVAMLVIFNTIRLTIFTQREEIGIMRLVGATNFFIRLPYLVEGVIYGLVSSVISIIVLFILLNRFSPFLKSFFEGQAESTLVYIDSHWWQITLVQIFFGIILSMLSSYISIWKYLRK